MFYFPNSVREIFITVLLILYFRIQQLEKDLYYYKKTSRDLKKKLREMIAGGSTGHTGGDGDKGINQQLFIFT